eukprot:7220821-Karenia_brevis.AAC.1
MTESRWIIFLQAIIYIMPEDVIDDMYAYNRHRPARKRALWYAKDIKDTQSLGSRLASSPSCGHLIE